jgi:gluconolactonase
MKSLLALGLMNLLTLLSVELSLGQDSGENKPIAGIGPVGPIKKWHTGFKFVEGPVADGKGNVYFSDLQANKIHKIDPEGNLSVFTDQLKGPNGLMFNVNGELVACEMNAGRIVAFDVEAKKCVWWPTPMKARVLAVQTIW